MSTEARLPAYYEFTDDVVADVSEAAQMQNRLTFQSLAAHYGVSNGPSTVLDSETNRPVEYLRLIPASDYDPSHARVLYSSMATPVNQSMTMRAMRFFGADPTQQVIVFGTPGSIGQPTGVLDRREARQVWRGDLTPTVLPAIRFLGDIGVRSVDHLGYSFGADKAVTATTVAEQYGIRTKQQVLMESASTVDRGLLRLLRAFVRSEAPLQEYVDRNESAPLLEARQLADSGLARYVGGLLRMTNVAIAHALAHDRFGDRLETSMRAAPTVQSTILWGGKSEIADDSRLTEIADSLRAKYPDRVRAIVIPDMHHAGGDDIDLHAAMILQSLRAFPTTA